jgi:hypothetical protein
MTDEPMQIIDPYPGGNRAQLNITKPALVTASPDATLCRAIVNLGADASGSLTLNDAGSLEAADSANQLLSLTVEQLQALKGYPILKLMVPMQNGIVVSAVPTNGSVAISYLDDDGS